MTGYMSKENPYTGREAVMFDFACDAEENGEHFVYIKIPGNIGPIERGDRFEDPLGAKLDELELGTVTGGGSQLGEGNTVEYCGIDVLLKQREEGLPVLLEILRSLGVPAGTVVEEYLPLRVDHQVHQKR